MKKAIPYLTVDEAIVRLQEIKEQAGTGDIPFLANSGYKEFQLCDIVLARAGASDMYRSVTRGGVPVASVSFGPPAKPTQ